MITALLSLGFFVAIPFTGRAALGRLDPYVPAVARPSLRIAAGAAIWSVPLLGTVAAGIYHPEIIGAAGWITAIVLGYHAARHRPTHFRRLSIRRADAVVLVGLLAAAGLAAAFPADPFVTTRDQTTYASHAIYIANHGRLDVPYASPPSNPATEATLPPGNIYLTHPSMTVRFSNLWPDWLAQTYASFGFDGMIRLNIVLGFLALLVVYGFATRLVRPAVAAAGVLLLAFNPAQLWLSRQTLSEVATQLLIWAALLLIVAFLKSGRKSWGVWAGAMFGLAAFVHIDGLVLFPLLVGAHFLWRTAARETAMGAAQWAYIYLGAVPVFGLALGYYAVFSNPYLLELRGQLELILLGTVAGLALLATTYSRDLRKIARTFLTERIPVLGGLLLLLAGAAYAYFIRPVMPPFATIDAPGQFYDGLRTYAEDALPNLGRYLTPGVVWFGLLGWSLIAFRVMTRRARLHLIPLLVISIGFTVLYVWNQNAWPTHFWAIRRFMPVIIPAIVVFAVVGVSWLLQFLSRPGRRLATGLVGALLIGYTLFVGAPMYVVAEGSGSYGGLATFAASVPDDGRVIALDGVFEAAHYWMPLYLAFDRPITPFDVDSDVGRKAAIAAVESASLDGPVTVVTGAYDFRMDSLVGTRTADVAWSSPVMVETTNPVPHDVTTQSNDLTAISVTGLNTVGVPFGGSPQWIAPGTGFHPAQLVNGRPLRWTDGEGKLAIPIEGGLTPRRLTISIADTGPNGGPLRITLNGEVLFDEVVAAGSWSDDYDIMAFDLQPGATANVEITSDTFESTPVGEADRETAFGVQIDQVVLLGQ